MTTIALSIVRSPEPGPVDRFQAQGPEVTVGRDPDKCDWVLPDPRRNLSRTHFRLEQLAGAWQVRDLSANGTFLNEEPEPIGRECLRMLRRGDRLRLGDYEIEVILLPEGAPAAHGTYQPPDRLDGIPRAGSFAGVRLPGLDDPSPPGVFAPMDARAPRPDASPFGAMPDHSPATSDAFRPPPAVAPAGDAAAAPDDWFRSMLMPSARRPAPPPPAADPSTFEPTARAPLGPAPGAAVEAPAAWGRARVVPETPPGPVDVPLQVVPPAAPTQPLPGSTLTALTMLMAAAGLAADSLPRAAQDPDKVLRQAGALLQASIAGLRALLIARSLVKREFRIEQTVLRPKENNPLKFASSDEQALAALLDPRAEGLQAVQQTIGDLTEHEVAVMSATQAAARAMLEGLSPAALEAEDPGGGMLPGATEKRLWAAYKRRHAMLLAQLEDDFDSAFGTAFARAYEQAVNSGGQR
ncbi:MAG: type VI secretion system-associated FHA domain protein TagH [Burkholderiaceae bacterium]|nr:type VI secretion system-associated FHA domain protein TagH [Burkholderiaceae bacterium]